MPLSLLPPAAREGFEYALELAEDHKRCSEEPPWRRDLPPLTVEDIADAERISPAQLRGRISRARHILFGDLSDAAIAKRVQRQRARNERPCAQPGCPEPISTAAAGNRRYCCQHGTGSERVRRHRRRRATEGKSR